MKMFASYLFLLALFVIVNVANTQESSCCNKFEYEYRVIQNLVRLDENQTRLLHVISRQNELIGNLTKHAEDSTNKIKFLYRTVNQLKSTSQDGPAATYTRWGRTTCPENGTELVYEGYAGGSHYSHSGGAVDYLCLPREPLWGNYDDSLQNGAFMYGAEYEMNSKSTSKMFPEMDHDIAQHDAPCAVCRTKRASAIMIPARNECYDGWTLEYSGYLSAGYYGQAAASEYICLDDKPETVTGSHANMNGILFYFVEGRCGSLKCPPYVHGRELTCAVCTK